LVHHQNTRTVKYSLPAASCSSSQLVQSLENYQPTHINLDSNSIKNGYVSVSALTCCTLASWIARTVSSPVKHLTLYRIVMPPGTTLLNFKNGYFFSEISLSNIHILKLEDMIVQLI